MLTPEDNTWLKQGHELWMDFERFTQDNVDTVKGIFRKAFRLPGDIHLHGLTFPDAIVLQPVGDEHAFYAMVMSEDGDGVWEPMRLVCEGNMCWIQTTPFRVVLALLECSVHGLTVDTFKEDGDSGLP